jgi:hypothetical protein
VTIPERAFGADQQLVEAVAAIVLLEAVRPWWTEPSGSTASTPATSARIGPKRSTCVPPALVETSPPMVRCPRAERQRESACPCRRGSWSVARITPASAMRIAASALDRADAVHPPQRQDQRRAVGGRRRAADHRGVAALRHQRHADARRASRDDRRDFLGRCRARIAGDAPCQRPRQSVSHGSMSAGR